MKRRPLLVAAGTVVTTGCTTLAVGDTGDTTTTRAPVDPEAFPEATFETIRECYECDEESRCDADVSHVVLLWNAVEKPRDVKLELGAVAGNVLDPFYSETVSFPADGVLRVELLAAADYYVEVDTLGAGADFTRIQSDASDGDPATTYLAITEDGQIASTTE